MVKTPTYSMQAVFDIREKAKKNAEDDYLQKKREVDIAKNLLKKMNADLDKMIDDRKKKAQQYAEKMQLGSISIDEIQMSSLHIKRLKDEESNFMLKIDSQKQLVEEKQQVCNKAMEQMLQATKEFKVIQKHKEKWLSEIKKAQQKKEEEAADDISQSQYFLKHK